MTHFIKRTWAEIDLDAAAHNFSVIRRAAGERAVVAVVKADAYGHGAARMALALRHARMTVETKGEHGVIELRKHLARYVAGRREAAALRVRLQTARTLGQIEQILLDTCGAQQYNEEAHP